MQMIISARGLTVSTTYKDAPEPELAKLEPLWPKPIEAKVVLSKEKHRRTAGLTLIAKHHTFRSEETAPDLAAAVEPRWRRSPVRCASSRSARGPTSRFVRAWLGEAQPHASRADMEMLPRAKRGGRGAAAREVVANVVVRKVAQAQRPGPADSIICRPTR